MNCIKLSKATGLACLALMLISIPLLGAGCGSDSEDTVDKVKVGFSICYTGVAAEKGRPMGNAKLDCIKYINEELGGVAGYQIEVIWRDNQYDASKATTIVSELMDAGCLLFTTNSSKMMMASAETANRNDFPGFAVFSSPVLTNPPQHIYAQMPDYGDDWAAFAKYYLDNIWKEIVHQAMTCFGLSLSFIHYDITSIYFEGAYEEADKLAYGYSRDDKSDCKQVNLQLNITGEDGIPLAFEVINGSISDRTTPIENMHALREVLEGMPTREDVILVSDQAMLDRDVIVQYHQQGIGYLGPLPALKEYEEVVMARSLAEVQEHPLSYRPKRQKAGEPPIYYGVLVPVTISGDKVEGTVEAQGLLVYSTRKAKLDADKRTTRLDRYLARLDTIKRHLNTRKYKKAAYTWEQLHKAQSKYAAVKELVEVQLEGEDGQLVLRVDVRADPMTLAQERDGRSLLVTNRPLSAEEMMKHFKAQDQIEKRNQTLKGPIRIRPIFLHKQERIESLITEAQATLGEAAGVSG